MKYLSFPQRILIFFFLFAATALAQTATDTNRNAILYEVSGNGLEKPSYVFGTIHVVCVDEMLDLEQLSPFLGSTEQSVMEIDLGNPIEMLGNTAPGAEAKPTSLTKIYTKDELEILDKMSREYLEVPILALNSLDPSLIQILLLGSPKMLGCAQVGSYDLALAQKFKESKTTVHGLETVGEQLNLFSASTEKSDSSKDLLKFVTNLESFKQNLRKLMVFHKDQNLDGLQAEALSQMENDADAEHKFLTVRNLAWLPKLEAFFRDKPTFVAVGAAHLGGNKGVLSLLEEKGYSVKAMRLEGKK